MQRCKAKHKKHEDELKETEAEIRSVQEKNHNLQRDYDTMVELCRRAIGERNQVRHEHNVLQVDYTQAVRDSTQTGGQLVLANAQLGQVNAQLAHANNQVRFGIQTLGQLRNRLFQQIAALQLNPPLPPPNNSEHSVIWLLLGLPIFEGCEDENFDRFIELYKGYLHSLNINPADAAGGPLAGYKKALGILQACLKGHTAEWYDNNILEKKVRLRNILACIANGAAQYQQVHNVAGNFMNEIWPGYEIDR
ncbi:hypothetical protein RhiirA4_476088 [Rhizophagus irregularis]|uniref:Uncharacterized protein n=1 Tax=Rhizophagus irregularis TaxID=588596 RepID=A0A2I1HB01_9GLOM|nr:hypothetical protein RhiirA4_476088 [Rhizophagus irregularis]